MSSRLNPTTPTSQAPAHRVLVIDDTPAIHDDYRKVLGRAGAGADDDDDAAIADMESVLFGEPEAAADDYGPAFDVESALQGEAGVAMLKAAVDADRPFSMAFVDMRMPPGWDGVRTIRELWKVDPELQVVICTAYSDYGPDQIARALGTDGRMLILRKPFDSAEVRQLAGSLCEKRRAGWRNADLQREVDVRTAELRRVALHDALTGLPNRMLFSEQLDHVLRQARRDESRKFAVLFIDADDFKVVNDSLGHDAGDALLLQMAERIRGCVRGADTVSRGPAGGPGDFDETTSMAARLGGDEFAVILDPIKSDLDAARIARRLLEAAAEPYEIKGHRVTSTMSIGITVSTPTYLRAEEMLRDADTAMYHAKRAGRSQFAMFDPSMHAEAVARLTFESELRDAIARGQIEAYYQPIVEMQTRRLAGFEALARWNHPTRGLLPPSEFIPMAEQSGLISILGLQVLDQACRQLAAWQAANPAATSLTMSVNLSRKQLTSRNLDQRVEQIIRSAGVDPRNIRLEITEHCVMRDEEEARKVLRKLQALQVQLHMDDFGRGQSVLSRLHDVPMDGLKLDRDFVREVAKRPDHAAIVKAIVGLARGLKIPLVAEGVETVEESRVLASLGCDFAQGYLFSQPMPAAAAGEFIKAEFAAPGRAA